MRRGGCGNTPGSSKKAQGVWRPPGGLGIDTIKGQKASMVAASRMSARGGVGEGVNRAIIKGLIDYEIELKCIMVAIGATSGLSFFVGKGFILINSLGR